jgi:hypothetical protein
MWEHLVDAGTFFVYSAGVFLLAIAAASIAEEARRWVRPAIILEDDNDDQAP